MWRKLLGRPVQPFTELVADAPLHEPLLAPSADRRALDAEQLAKLPRREHPGSDEPLLQAGELRGGTDPLDGDGIEWLTSAGMKSAFVEDVRDLGVEVVVGGRTVRLSITSLIRLGRAVHTMLDEKVARAEPAPILATRSEPDRDAPVAAPGTTRAVSDRTTERDRSGGDAGAQGIARGQRARRRGDA